MARMSRKPFEPSPHISVEIHLNKEATLRGINHANLRSILTSAALYCYEQVKRFEGPGKEESLAYYEEQLELLDVVQGAMTAALMDTHKHVKIGPGKREVCRGRGQAPKRRRGR